MFTIKRTTAPPLYTRLFTALVMCLVISESIYSSCYDIVDVINAYLLTAFIILQEKDSDIKTHIISSYCTLDFLHLIILTFEGLFSLFSFKYVF